MSNINFNVREREVSAGGVRISIGMPISDREPVHNNELLNILNTLKRSQWADPMAQVGFDYTLDFAFDTPDRFPYALDMTLA